MKRLLTLVIALLVAPVLVHAQSPVITQPYGVTSHNDSSTIASTNVFQSIWSASTNVRGRAGCIVQNIGSSTQFVFVGAIASALTTTSYKLAAGQVFNCTIGGTVLKDQISITGTSGDEFFAIQQ